ncbi:MAG: hypothetical protein WKG03_09470 [Telluria sp.]
MKRRPSDVWLGAAVVLAFLSLLGYVLPILTAVWVVAHLALIGVVGLGLVHLWLKPQHGLQRLACALLTLPVLTNYGVLCAVAVFMTMWNTHVGHDFRMPAPRKILPSGAESA